eukprot:TRINITY_DN4832_c0_g1_i4.p1 TRINITY_DN4832_c0_g1~~TRINITY_DN4832_c0_g1_i4.p1  ORF type:complete len:483 (-),score=99.16 TRINITY_DN4832_c0_g1_i4:7-1455(-)
MSSSQRIRFFKQKPDRMWFKARSFSYLILDEAQTIKSSTSIVNQHLSKVRSKQRLLLTGTPLQNSLNELWTLLMFLMPRVFSQYQNLFSSLAREKDLPVAFLQRMRSVLEPFMLRRLKSEVFSATRHAVSATEVCEMTSTQRARYFELIRSSRTLFEQHLRGSSPITTSGKFSEEVRKIQDLDADSDEKPKKRAATGAKRVVSNIVMDLRKMANHPLLFRNLYGSSQIETVAQHLHKSGDKSWRAVPLADVRDDLLRRSDFEIHELCETVPALRSHCLPLEKILDAGKMQGLQRLLQMLRAQGRRTLLFSQMTKVLDILQWYLGSQNIGLLRLDGSTPVSNRLALIDEFARNRSIEVFLLSTRAGGAGINLSSADAVIFYDVDWNPEVDRQAEARCIRPADRTADTAGEPSKVLVFRLVAQGTIDEHMLAQSQRKKSVNDITLGETEEVAEEPTGPRLMDLLSVILSGTDATEPPSKQREKT